MKQPKWLEWSRRIQAVAQSGLQYTTNPFDIARYKELSRIAAEIMAEETQTDPDEVRMIFEAQSGYATPKIDTRGVVYKDGRILLVRELNDGGRWTLPGGWVDVGERPSEAVERELREEAGVVVKAQRLLAVYDNRFHGHPLFPFHSYKLFFECDLIAEATPDPIETSEPSYFLPNALPELSLLRITEEEIHRMFELSTDTSLQTDFD